MAAQCYGKQSAFIIPGPAGNGKRMFEQKRSIEWCKKNGALLHDKN
jgi:hypothetical protein